MELENFIDEETEEQEFSFDYKRYLFGIYKRKWIAAGLFLLIVVPWFLNIKSQLPVYEAFTWIRFKNYDPERLQLIFDDRFTELTSKTSAKKIVAQLGLTLDFSAKDKKTGIIRQDIFTEFLTNQDPDPGSYLLACGKLDFTLYKLDEKNESQEEIASGKILEIIDRAYSINGFTFRLNPEFFQSNDEIVFNINPFDNAVDWFRSNVNVSPSSSRRLMHLRMIHQNPKIAALMVNNLAQIFIDESLSFDQKREKEYNESILKQLGVAKNDLAIVQNKLKQFNELHGISLEAASESRIKEISNLTAQHKKLDDSIKTLTLLFLKLDEFESEFIRPGMEDSEIRYIYNQIVKNFLFTNDVNMGLLESQMVGYENHRNDILSGSTLSNPEVRDADQKIASVQIEILGMAKNRLEEAKLERSVLNRQASKLRSENNKLPGQVLTLANLTRDKNVAETLYTELNKKESEFRISEASKSEEIDILDPAEPPTAPMNREKQKNAIIGGIFALFFSLGMVIFLEFMDKSVKSPADIKKYLKLDVIGTIPRVEFENEHDLKDADKLKHFDSQLVTYDYSPTPISEAYRALRTKIVYSKKTGQVKTFVITSFAPGDGKSFTSANLAITLAQHKTNTILIDSDLRRGVLHNTFGIKKEPGISNLLMGMVKFDDIVQETYVPNLSIVSCGSMMPNPSELLGSVYLKQFIEEAKSRFDTVIFDSPPLNAATDAVVLGTQLDGVVLIVRADTTNRNVAKQKLDLFDNVPANILGVILNGANTELAHDGYSYYHY